MEISHMPCVRRQRICHTAWAMAPTLRINQPGGSSLRQELEMAELSPLDIELLSQGLPELSQVAVESPVYAGGRGLIEYRAAGDRRNPPMLMLHGLGSSSAGDRAQFSRPSRNFHRTVL